MAKTIPDPTSMTTTPALEQITMHVYSPPLSPPSGEGALRSSTPLPSMTGVAASAAAQGKKAYTR
jgi:hypothetical protein